VTTTTAATAATTELDLAGELPSGTVVLQASAGTGKTYAIAALVTRAVAEGVCTLPQLLVVTFTRAATAELRDRVRQRLVGAERHLRGVLAGTVTPATSRDDVVLAHLAHGDAEVLEVRRERLAAALTDFDAATIATIHGFTQQVLRSVGLSADVPRDVTLLEDETDLLDQVTADVYVRRYLGRADDETRPSLRVATGVARAVAANPAAELRPGTTDDDPAGAELAGLARDLRTELAARKRRDGTLGYDDLLVALRDALEDEHRGDAAVAILRDRYRWALIDEFQDTDPVQWDILRRAFRGTPGGDRALVLIGDPKQAIYSFRGADVRAYLEATDAADRRFDLATNYRSDGPLLAATDRLLTGTTFGETGIEFVGVHPSDDHAASAIEDDRDAAALQLRVYDPPKGRANVDAIRQRFADDVATTLGDQLGRVRVGADRHPLRPGDVAVLVRTNAEAALVQQALREVRIPSVVNGVGSVLETVAADDWRWLLEAVERPSDAGRMRRLALSAWFGWDASELAGADDDALDGLHTCAGRWATVLVEHGVASLERTVLHERGVAGRVLASFGGERHLTDLRHVGRLLHTAELEEDRGVSSLLAWLLTARAEAGSQPTPSDEQARRLESDAACVQILTVHRSKGLQYPVVLVPFQWGQGAGIGSPFVTYDPDTGDRVVDVGPTGRPGSEALKDAATRDAVGEALRLLYVAVTRAQHRVVLWWPCPGSKRSALARVLFGRADDGTVQLDTDPDPPKAAADQVDLLGRRFGGPGLSIAHVPPPDDTDPPGWDDGDDGSAELSVAAFDRTLDRAWRRTSYTGIVRRAGTLDGDPHTAVGTEPDVTAKDDEPGDVAGGDTRTRTGPDGAPDDHRLRADLPLGDLRGGTAFGTFVHAVLEHADFAADDLEDHLGATVDDQLGFHRVPGAGDRRDTLVTGLAAAIRSPLGPLAGRTPDGRWRRLADLRRGDRLDELDFELPLAGGDAGHRRGAAVALSRLADLLERPATDGGLTDDDPLRLAGYADRLRTPGYELDLRGYLGGSIDLVARVTGEDGTPRFLVADHKSNRLGGDAVTQGAYRPAALVDAMIDHDYPLQALLYSVALHRFLRWRVPAYDPTRHLGGVLYLFLRGMAGPDTPEVDGYPCGVFAWHPPAAVIRDLSDLLDGEVAP
jgi:exodeoxyribonuclease V beta subunit